MALNIRDRELAFAALMGPDGLDAFATSTVPFNISIHPARKLKIGWMVGPGFGPVDLQVAAAFAAAADALKAQACRSNRCTSRHWNACC